MNKIWTHDTHCDCFPKKNEIGEIYAVLIFFLFFFFFQNFSVLKIMPYKQNKCQCKWKKKKKLKKKGNQKRSNPIRKYSGFQMMDFSTTRENEDFLISSLVQASLFGDERFARAGIRSLLLIYNERGGRRDSLLLNIFTTSSAT